jgi:transposase
MTVMITRLGQDASELRLAAAHSADAKVARRLLALALVLEGRSRAEAAQSCGMDRQTLRDWVHRYNEHGIAGLSDQPHGGGQAPRLTPQEQQEVARWVRRGPDPRKTAWFAGAWPISSAAFSSGFLSCWTSGASVAC